MSRITKTYEWKDAKKEKPTQGERVLLKIQHEPNPVVGYWGSFGFEACTENLTLSNVEWEFPEIIEDFESNDVIYWKYNEPSPDEEC